MIKYLILFFLSLSLKADQIILTHNEFTFPNYAYFKEIINYECILTLDQTPTVVLCDSVGKTPLEGLVKLFDKIPFGAYIFWVRPVYKEKKDNKSLIWANFPVYFMEK